MRVVLKREGIPQLDAWGVVLFLFLLEFFSYVLVALSLESRYPSSLIGLFTLLAKVSVHVFMLVFCIIRFGRINLLELVPNRRDALILLIALVIEFWVFGVLVGSEGIQNDRHLTIRDLPAVEYWLAVSVVVGWGPLLEEALFRRYFLEIQRQHYSTITAILITASVATLFHFTGSFFRLLWHFPQQLFLSFVYVKSRLGVSVLVHAFVNALVLFLSR